MDKYWSSGVVDLDIGLVAHINSGSKVASEGSNEAEMVGDDGSVTAELGRLRGRWAWRRRLRAYAADSFGSEVAWNEAEPPGCSPELGAAQNGGALWRPELGFRPAQAREEEGERGEKERERGIVVALNVISRGSSRPLDGKQEVALGELGSATQLLHEEIRWFCKKPPGL
jgi:hypothetical protein